MRGVKFTNHFHLGMKLIMFRASPLFRVLYFPLLTSFLTPWSRVLLEKLTGLQLVKKFPAFYVTPKFITAFTSANHLSLS